MKAWTQESHDVCVAVVYSGAVGDALQGGATQARVGRLGRVGRVSQLPRRTCRVAPRLGQIGACGAAAAAPRQVGTEGAEWDAYAAAASLSVRSRLALGGVRLALLLNSLAASTDGLGRVDGLRTQPTAAAEVYR